MKKTIVQFTCDRCGRSYEEADTHQGLSPGSIIVQATRHNVPVIQATQFDMCPSCTYELVKWWKRDMPTLAFVKEQG